MMTGFEPGSFVSVSHNLSSNWALVHIYYLPSLIVFFIFFLPILWSVVAAFSFTNSFIQLKRIEQEIVNLWIDRFAASSQTTCAPGPTQRKSQSYYPSPQVDSRKCTAIILYTTAIILYTTAIVVYTTAIILYTTAIVVYTSA